MPFSILSVRKIPFEKLLPRLKCWFSFLRWGLGQFSYWLVFADLILANQNIRQQKLPIPFFYHYYRPGQAKAGIKEISALSRLLWLTFMLTVYLKMSSTGADSYSSYGESGENQGSFEAGVGQALSWTTLSAGKHSDFQFKERLVAGAIPVSLPPGWFYYSSPPLLYSRRRADKTFLHGGTNPYLKLKGSQDLKTRATLLG